MAVSYRNTKRVRLMRGIKKQVGLIGYWPLAETSGAVAVDYSPTRNNGTILNAGLSQPGTIGKAMGFTSGSASVNIPSNAIYAASQAVTYTCLFKLNRPHANGSAEAELLKEDTPYIFDLHGNGLIEFAVNTGAGYTSVFSSKSSWNANQWYMPLLQHGGAGSMQVYVNGTLDNGQGTVGIGTAANKMFLFNQDGLGGAQFPGTVQHVAIYNNGFLAGQARKLAHYAGLI